MEDSPLPRPLLRGLFVAVILLAVVVVVLQFAMPTLRQGRLLDEALQVTESRRVQAALWLEREPTTAAALDRERREAVRRLPHLLRTDEAVQIRAWLQKLARDAQFEVGTVRLGTVREGETFDTVPASIQITGDRAELPPFLARFYDQPRVVRIVALDVETHRFGSERIAATLRWEFAAAARRRAAPPDPSARWSPPVVAAPANAGGVSSFNQKRWERLDSSATQLRQLHPALMRASRMEAERARLEQERRSLAHWQDAARAEKKAVLRKTPLLLHQLDVSAMGRAGLRPGPGGTLQIVDDD
ncbi:MAG: hypothetical protein VX498_13865 [Myxococcota bacterium]|nr:hypothetical protein [Myxococcota bacterium]